MRATASGLLIPGSVTSVDPPKFACAVCKAKFKAHEGALFERHVVRCADQHEAELRERSLRVRAPGLFGDEAFDPEYERWVRRSGRMR